MNVTIPAPHGQLEGIFWPGTARIAAVACHPHPLHGGTMHNKVIYQAARGLRDAGVPVLRFNFRGVGASTGAYDDGNGELYDVAAAADWLEQQAPGVPLAVVGFSFGAWVGLRAGCADPRVRALAGIGLPLRLLTFRPLPECRLPKLIVQAEHDEHGPLPAVQAWLESLPDPKHLVVVPDTGHLFTGRERLVGDAVRDFFQALQQQL